MINKKVNNLMALYTCSYARIVTGLLIKKSCAKNHINDKVMNVVIISFAHFVNKGI